MWEIWGRLALEQHSSYCVTSNVLLLLCSFAIFGAVSGQASCSAGPCYPSPSNISKYSNVTANSTCGDPPEPYCVYLDCSKVCNAKYNDRKHPANFVNDDFRNTTFWKSKNFEFPVVLQLGVGGTFLFYQSVVTFYHELPAAMYLLKSNDSGRTWSPLTYFATNCTKYFNLPETPKNKTEGLKVQCFKIDTATNLNRQLFYTPMQDPAVAQNLLTDTEKQAFFLMTDIRMVLVKFVIPGGVDPESLSVSLKRSFFFTVSDWDVLASCFCNGQASQCDPNDFFKCICEKNTDGPNCEKCLPLYNNKPYQMGEACEACECNNHADSCSYNKTKGYGFCNDCKHNTTGDKCELCKETFHRNPAVLQNASNTCLGCISCGCNPAGSASPVCNKTTGQCPCKAQSLGRQCDICPAGYYGLSIQNPEGCLKCQCSNKSSDCVTDQGWFVSGVNTTLSVFNDNSDLDGWTTKDSAGNQVTLLLDWDVTINIERGSVKVDTQGSNDIYFVAPDKYLGDKRCAYTYTLSFHLQQDNASNLATSFKGDVILEGKWFDEPLVLSLDTAPPDGDNFRKYEVKLVESNWRVGNTSGRQPSSDEMIVVLSHLTSLCIRAKWTTLTTKLFTRLANIELTLSSRGNVIPGTESAFNIENCTCPVEYKGQFCEQCASGYTRVTPNGGPYLTCVPCECNGHSDKCNPETGACLDCQHNSTGDHCEKCSDGWYGNATNATPNDCSPCACPSRPNAVNQFAKTCVLSSDSLSTCVNCTVGHEGRYCERCMDGYFGRPREQDGQCRKCNCNNNTDPAATGNCNTTTGECLNCLYNTTGSNCQWCAPGYHGNALNKTCTRCNCLAVNALNNECNNITGSCNCHPYVTGKFCDRCKQNAFNYTASGCAPCDCNSDGSVDLQCDLVYGNCSCKPNVIGKKCDMCAAGFFNVQRGCLVCNCSSVGSNNPDQCHRNGGQCSCKPNVIGRTCDQCKPNYFNFTSGLGCQACNCSTVGAVNRQCNSMNGSCSCHPYVTGKLCSSCEQNAFNYTSSGCTPCDCDIDGSTDLQCDLTYGNCSCRPNVIGRKCDVCNSGFFGVKQGCLACNCSSIGSNSPDQCDRNSGQCFCKPNVIGRTCDQCRPDYFNLTSAQGCQACACLLPGVKTSVHSTQCDNDSGQCLCNSRVTGRTCDMCRHPFLKISSVIKAGCIVLEYSLVMLSPNNRAEVNPAQ